MQPACESERSCIEVIRPFRSHMHLLAWQPIAEGVCDDAPETNEW